MDRRIVIALTLIIAAGCANPADDKPEAKVGEAAPAGEHATGGKDFVLGEGSKIEFVGSKVTGSHDGGFESISGTIHLVDGDPAGSSVEVEIDATSIWTDNDKLTGHLKSPDFFDVENHPKASFQSTAIAKTADGYDVTGNLMLRGVTKSIQFPATITVADDAVDMQAEFVVMRFDFDIAYPGKADDLIRDEVVVKFALNASPKDGGGW